VGLYLIGAAVALVLLGAVLWFTAFIAWPLAFVLAIAGVAMLVREGRHSRPALEADRNPRPR
jgi:membrane protein implicated in regulation of membrane protease activity